LALVLRFNPYYHLIKKAAKWQPFYF